MRALPTGSPAFDMWQVAPRPEQMPGVLLLLDHRSASWVAIQRATRVADALGGALHVALAIPRGTAHEHPALVVSHVADLLRAVRPRFGFDLEVFHGGVSERGIKIARETAPALVVVDARFGAAEARKTVDKLGIPVLVARDARPDGELLAASDMASSQFPVLACARTYARVLERQVSFFHNAKPLGVFVADPMMAGGTSYANMLQIQDDAAVAKAARLRHLAERDRHVDTFVTRAESTVDALLELARERDADLIVIGHRRRSWIRRTIGRCVAERVIEQSRRSVLVVPLGVAA